MERDGERGSRFYGNGAKHAIWRNSINMMQADNLVSERNFQWKLEDKRKVLSDVEALRIEQEIIEALLPNWTKASDDDDSSVDLTYQEAKHHG